FLTARDSGERLTPLPLVSFSTAPAASPRNVRVDPDTRYQTMIGFGGAFTEAAAVTLATLPPDAQDEIIRTYFDPVRGHGYSVCRTHINSCDFSLKNYAYDETPGDEALEDFSIDHDKETLIPLIKKAFRAAGRPFKLLASPWSPPAWMKTTGTMNGGGKLRPEYRAAWAAYYCRYIQAYRDQGIPIWALTVQNEPEAAQTWDSCEYTAEEERDFVRDFLGPALHTAGLADVKLCIWDHNRDRMYERARTVLGDTRAANFVWGTAFHWYCGDYFENVAKVHEAFPNKHLIFSEGCQEGGPHIGSWDTGERYGRSLIKDLNNWTEAWIDWNLVLDSTGGPNHQGNLCSAPVLIDTERKEILYQSSYYYLGHFSRFIRPGAVRLHSAADDDRLETAAFRNSDGKTTVVVMNRTEETLPFTLRRKDVAALFSSPPHSILTLCF
ncbi:MAG TPA: glucosylceramidase, partial [Spirochaetia bacterium]|nr:glucosylceramidase [Spirochaetia bacterium]